jgi:D-psicose/D-tagatose/L-ribulose 3-epimerase
VSRRVRVNIKFGCNTLIWVLSFTDKDFKILDLVKKMGGDLVEITPGDDFKKLSPEKLRKKLEAVGLEATVCAALSAAHDISSADSSVRQSGIDFVKELADWAHEIGARFIGGPIYSELGKKRYLSDRERKAEWNRSADSLKRIGDEIGKKDVTVALEPINRFEIDMMNTAAQAFAMCEQVKNPSIRMMLDTFHMNIEDKKIGDAIRASKKHLVHMHFCSNNRGIPGDDHIPWAEVKQALSDINYVGYGVIESFAQGQVAAFANIWRPLVKNQDDIPREGLKFLKKNLV